MTEVGAVLLPGEHGIGGGCRCVGRREGGRKEVLQLLQKQTLQSSGAHLHAFSLKQLEIQPIWLLLYATSIRISILMGFFPSFLPFLVSGNCWGPAKERVHRGGKDRCPEGVCAEPFKSSKPWASRWVSVTNDPSTSGLLKTTSLMILKETGGDEG